MDLQTKVTAEIFFTDPVVCYFLDAFLIVYCLIATMLFFREKFVNMPKAVDGASGDGGIYQELERPKDADPYEVLEPSKAKKKPGRKKKSESTREAEEGNKEPSESLILNGSDPTPPAPR
ncbi:T-cell surface glycoprotein CD3 zeta chain-like isoform X2 [Sebastes umbrosus]|uniref:T-cell surface glycoprotein CD3 zeta chain-like isoform X2 n=1 Tax=Sebastes umbrosus TaxID=72105 RepID=UPI0018A00E7A|nr:T-cell surface glycoprotein CD3 zeta chain-like isoform X2 [Sebastes umbrosus]